MSETAANAAASREAVQDQIEEERKRSLHFLGAGVKGASTRQKILEARWEEERCQVNASAIRPTHFEEPSNKAQSVFLSLYDHSIIAG